MSDALRDFAQRRRDAATTLDTLASKVAAVDESHATRLASLAERTRDGVFRVVLLGCFSSGKKRIIEETQPEEHATVRANRAIDTSLTNQILHS